MAAFSQQLEVSASIACASVAEAYSLFLQVVWREGGGLGSTQIEVEGDAHSGLGCIRRVPGGIREEIKGTSADSITYTIVSGVFPVAAHEGHVTFHQQADAIAVHWVCRFTPLFGFGWILPTIIRTAFRKSLSTLKARANNR